MPSSIMRFVHHSLEKFGYRLVRMEGRPGVGDALSQFFSLLKRQAFNPSHIIDVWRKSWELDQNCGTVFPNAQYTLIESQEFLKECVQDLVDSGYKIRWITAGAGDVPGTIGVHAG